MLGNPPAFSALAYFKPRPEFLDGSAANMEFVSASGTGTTLNLLTRHGAIAVHFSQVLTPTQYEAVYDCVRNIDDCSSMSKMITRLAEAWGMGILVDSTNDELGS
jgi:hypothetical protein